MTVRARTVVAAGAVLWRRRHGRLQVALIHRPLYDDWSWPKGKLDPGESWAVAATREVEEETGLVVRLGRPLPRALYVVPQGELKEVRYWSAQPTGGHGELRHEVDQVRWALPSEARTLLTHRRDALQLQSLVEADAQGQLETWPLVVLRHAQSQTRTTWRRDDHLRPLDNEGRLRAHELIPLLSSYGPLRVVSSGAVRCLETIEPYVRAARVDLKSKRGLSEEGYVDDPDKAIRHTRKALGKGTPVLLCTHRPVLPAVLTVLAGQAAVDSPERAVVEEASRDGLDKGEAMVLHIAGTGADATVVAVERHRPA